MLVPQILLKVDGYEDTSDIYEKDFTGWNKRAFSCRQHFLLATSKVMYSMYCNRNERRRSTVEIQYQVIKCVIWHRRGGVEVGIGVDVGLSTRKTEIRCKVEIGVRWKVGVEQGVEGP